MEDELKNEIPDYGEILASWNFPEHTQHERRSRWYIFFIIVVGLLLLYSYKTSNILFAVIIIMSAVFLTMHNRTEPRLMELKITEDGILLNDIFYNYSDFKNFVIIYRPSEVKNLYFEFKGTFRPRLTIPLEDQNPNKIRNILLEHLEEDLERENEPTSDFLARIFKI